MYYDIFIGLVTGLATFAAVVFGYLYFFKNKFQNIGSTYENENNTTHSLPQSASVTRNPSAIKTGECLFMC